MSKITVFLDNKCGPSKQMMKILKGLGKDIEVERVVIQADPARVLAENIKASPTIQIKDDNDNVIKTLVGYNVNIINRIEEIISGKVRRE